MDPNIKSPVSIVEVATPVAMLLSASSVEHTCTPVSRIRKTYMHAVLKFHARFFPKIHTMSECILPQARQNFDNEFVRIPVPVHPFFQNHLIEKLKS